MNAAQEMIASLRSSGMTQKRIAKALETTQVSVSRWESGVRVPSGRFMLELIELVKKKNE